MSEKFADLGTPRRVWAVAAIHGDRDRLMALHDHLATRFALGDRLVYLGNYLGVGSPDNEAIIEELLAFRSALLAKPGMEPSDIVHLRGPAEEAWQRLLRLQFAPLPSRMLEQLLKAGVEPYLRLYGIQMNDTKAMARADSVTITRWTNQLRVAQRLAPGHEPLVCCMKRAAVSGTGRDGSPRLLFVPAGFDSRRSLEDQGDNLWFGTDASAAENTSAVFYARIVRGFDPQRGGVVTEGTAVTLDGGCGFGGPLICGSFDAQGNLLEMITVGGQGALDTLPAKDENREEDYDYRTSASSRAERIAMSA
ncbi:MAG: hypothetical protein PHY92_09790 [Alphaproteobacteria bacterium]|nr:hypothetical protein [Alphaproteobacteria bacterium]